MTRSYQVTLPAAADGAPVFLEQVTTASGVKDLLFVNTTQGHILAVNAQTGAIVWSKQFAFSSAATSTSPAIDPNRQYVYTYGREGYVHKLLVGDGSEVLTGGWPQLVTLKPAVEKVSSALATATVAGTNYLYVATSGYPGDAGDYQGHVVTINLATGTQKVFNTLCSEQAVHFAQFPALPDCTSQKQTGAWGRPGVIYDAGTNRIFMATGNGKYDAANNHWGDSVLALTPDGTGVGGKPIDAYTPASFQSLQNADADLGSTSPAILPVPPTSNVQHLAVQGGKDSLLRLINLADLSGQGGPGHTGGEVGSLGINVGGQVLSQPAVWVNPADSTTWTFITNGSSQAFRLSIAANGNPSLVSQWTGGSGANSSPLVANNVLYVASGSTLRALNPVTKAQLWATGSAANTIGSIRWQSPVRGQLRRLHPRSVESSVGVHAAGCAVDAADETCSRQRQWRRQSGGRRPLRRRRAGTGLRKRGAERGTCHDRDAVADKRLGCARRVAALHDSARLQFVHGDGRDVLGRRALGGRHRDAHERRRAGCGRKCAVCRRRRQASSRARCMEVPERSTCRSVSW